MDEIEALFATLERIAGDPTFDKLMDDIKEMNQYLRSDPCSENEANDIIKGLRKQLRDANMDNAPIKVTGRVYMQDLVDDYDPDKELDPEFATSFVAQDMSLEGFTILTDEDAAPQIYLRASTLIEKAGDDMDEDDEDDDDLLVECVIPLKDEVSVVFEGMSAARSAAWLEIYQPEVKEELDVRLANCDFETEAVMALRDMKVPVADLNSEEISELKSHLRLYTASLVEFEKSALYVAELIGQAGIHNEATNLNEVHTIRSQDETFLAIRSIEYALNSHETQLEPLINAVLVGAKKHEEYVAYIPPNTFYSLISLREERRQAIRDRKAAK
jgi:hypothetical protein